MRQGRKRQATLNRRRPWIAIVALVAAALVTAWWLLGRTPVPVSAPSGSAILASYRPSDLHALAVSPADPRTVIFGSHRGVLVSHDGGATWSTVSGANGDAMGLALPAGSQTVYAAGHDAFFRSNDGGQSWVALRAAVPGTDIHGLAASASSPGTAYAYVVGSGLFKSSIAGTWSRIGDASGGTMSLASAKVGEGDVLIATTMEGVERSRDGGKTWVRVPELGTAYVSAAGDRAYAVAGSSVFVSADGGMTWAKHSFSRGSGALVAGAAGDPQLLYIVTERFEVWRSSDAGATWERAG